MWIRLFSLLLVSFSSLAAQAQLPSNNWSPLNYFGRYHGFGYSDGYHSCKDGNCHGARGLRSNLTPFSNDRDPIATFYGSPTTPSGAPLIQPMQVVPTEQIQATPSKPKTPETVPPAPSKPSSSPSDKGFELSTPKAKLEKNSPPMSFQMRVQPSLSAINHWMTR